MSIEVCISDKRMHFVNWYQVINMGGPFIGDLYENNTKIANDVFVDSLTTDTAKEKLFFAKYHLIKNKDYFFTLYFYDIESGEIYEYEKRFKMLFLGSIKNNEIIELYDAFHGEFEKSKFIFNLLTEPFNLVKK